MHRSVRLLATALALLASGPATASAYTFTFEGNVPDGAVVDSQYASKGLTLTAGGVDQAQRLPHLRLSTSEARSPSSRSLRISDPGFEFPTPDLSGRFTTSRTMVKLWARNVTDAQGILSVNMRLLAYRADGTLAASSAIKALSSNGPYSQFVATSDAPDIVAFRLRQEDGSDSGVDVRVDDLEVDDPVTPPPADFTISTPVTGTLMLPAGGANQTTVSIARINGSTGGLTFQVSGAAAGITPTFVPSTVSGTDTSTTLRLALSPYDRADTEPRTLTITATPANAAVGPAPRSVTLRYQRVPAFRITSVDLSDVHLQRCGPPVRREYRVQRTPGYTEPIQVSAGGDSHTLNGSLRFFQSDTELTGAEDRFTIDWSRLDTPTDLEGNVTVRATTADTLGEQLRHRMILDPSTIHHTGGIGGSGLGRGLAPQGLAPGERVRFATTGVCEGSTVTFGNPGAISPVELVATPTIAESKLPAGATDGPVTVRTPGGATITDPQPLDVQTYRDTHGFSFVNEAWGGGGFDDWSELFGAEQTFLSSPNLCAFDPNGHCVFSTPLPRPDVFLFMAIANPMLAAANGTCVGFAIGSRRLATGQVPMARFDSSARTVWQLPRTDRLVHFQRIQHQAQLSAEFIRQWWTQRTLGAFSLRTADAVQAKLEGELRAGHRPLVTLSQGGGGHAVIAYDVVPRGGGAFDILVYDPNVPHQDTENADAGAHEARDAGSRIAVGADGYWTFSNLGWRGGLGDVVVASVETQIPVRPTYPLGADGLLHVLFGLGTTGGPAERLASAGAPGTRASTAKAHSADRATRTQAAGPPDVVGWPMLDTPSPDPAYLASPGATHDFRVGSDAKGRQELSFFGAGSVAKVVATGAGKEGAVQIEPSAAGLSYASGPGASGATLDAILTDGAGTDAVRQAHLITKPGAAGRDRLAFEGPTFVVDHAGPPASASLELVGTGKDGLPQRFSTTVRLRRGERLSARPDWARLAGDRLTVTIGPKGRGRRVVLRNTTRSAVRVAGVSVRARALGQRAHVSARVQLAGSARSTATVVLSVVARRGKRIVGSTSMQRSPGKAGGPVELDLPVKGRLKGVRIQVKALAYSVAGDRVHRGQGEGAARVG